MCYSMQSLIISSVVHICRYAKIDDQTVFWHIVKVMTSPQFVEFPRCNTTLADELRSTLPVAPHTASDHLHDHENRNGTMIACPLDECLYSAGALSHDNAELQLRVELIRRKEVPILLHANWLDGHDKKVNALKRNSLWLAFDNWTCSDYHPWY